MYLLSVCGFFVLLLPAVLEGACGINNCLLCKDDYCTECKYGYHGYSCEKPCQGCWLAIDGCEIYTGRCKQCSPGYFTEACNMTCPTNCAVSFDEITKNCHRTTGACLEGCKNNYWGPQCQWMCSAFCLGSVCEQHDGSCIRRCIDGWFGMSCDRPCSQNCLQKRCSLIMGECLQGCKPGFTGLLCNISCENCIDMKCTYNDLDYTLNCTKGCKSGWTSLDCKQMCSSTCLHGICDRNGNCHTCLDGYYGVDCLKRCPQGCLSCKKTTGYCILSITTITTQVTETASISGSVALYSTLQVLLAWLGLQVFRLVIFTL